MPAILFVDEDASLRLLFSDALRAAGHCVETAPDADAAASLLKQGFDLVITDGLSLLRRVHRAHPESRVLLTTFRPGVPEAAFALSEGAIDYLIKPFDLDDAVLRIARMFERPEQNARTNILLFCEDDERAEAVRRMIGSGVDRGRRPEPHHDAVIVVGELDALLAVQALAPDLPLIALGGNGDEDLAVRAMQVGVQEFVPFKELDAKRLNRAIRCAIERKRTEHRLTYLAHHDHLTGLANRLLFRERLSHARSRSRRDKRKLALMFVDLDRFKSINDTLGHETGDTLLREVAKRLRNAVRDQDTVARLGSDEFAVLIEDVADRREAEVIAQRVLELIKEPINVEDDQLMITASIGIAFSPEIWDTTGELVSSAGEAVRLAKERGRDGYFMFGDDRARSQAEHELRGAIERKELILYYQPLRSIATRTMVGMEALLRWRRDGGTVVPPADFVPFLEESGLIVPVGAHVLDMACIEARRWQDAGHRDNRVQVNLSAVQLDRDDLPATVLRSLKLAGIAPELLELEITESMLMRDTARAQAALSSLKDRGVRIAVDDFGTGYSSLAYIHRFPIDTIKIDRTFVRQITNGGSGAAIVAAIIGLAHKLRMEVVAEGVETEEELAFLEREGCDLIQGFLCGRPQPASSLQPSAALHS